MKKSFFITCAILSILSSFAELILFFTFANSVTCWIHFLAFAPICSSSYFLMALACSKNKRSNGLFAVASFLLFGAFLYKLLIDLINLSLILAFSAEYWPIVAFVIAIDIFFNYILIITPIFIGLHYAFRGKIFNAKLKNALVILRAVILTVFSAFGITLTILGYTTAIPSFYLIINILSTIALICHKPHIAPAPSENNTVEEIESSAR